MSIALLASIRSRSMLRWLPSAAVLWGWLPAAYLSISGFAGAAKQHLPVPVALYAVVQWWLVPAVIGLLSTLPCSGDGRITESYFTSKLRSAALAAAFPSFITAVAVTWPRNDAVALLIVLADILSKVFLTYSPVIAVNVVRGPVLACAASISMMKQAAAIGVVMLGLGCVVLLPIICFAAFSTVISNHLAGQMTGLAGSLACGVWALIVWRLGQLSLGDEDVSVTVTSRCNSVRIIGDALFAAWLASLTAGFLAEKLPVGVLAWGIYLKLPGSAYASYAPFSAGGLLVPAACALVCTWFLQAAPVPTIASTAICKVVFLTNWRVLDVFWAGYSLLVYVIFAGLWVLVFHLANGGSRGASRPRRV